MAAAIRCGASYAGCCAPAYSCACDFARCKERSTAERLKEELFALESDKIAGTLPPAEYAEQKAALETVLKRALKKKASDRWRQLVAGFS